VMSPTILTEAQLPAAAKADMNDHGGVPPLMPAIAARLLRAVQLFSRFVGHSPQLPVNESLSLDRTFHDSQMRASA
jgi:hypothetical protein